MFSMFTYPRRKILYKDTLSAGLNIPVIRSQGNRGGSRVDEGEKDGGRSLHVQSCDYARYAKCIKGLFYSFDRSLEEGHDWKMSIHHSLIYSIWDSKLFIVLTVETIKSFDGTGTTVGKSWDNFLVSRCGKMAVDSTGLLGSAKYLIAFILSFPTLFVSAFVVDYRACVDRPGRLPRPPPIVGTKIRAASSQEGETMKVINGVREIVDDYDIFLLDMWGVMHDGSRPYEGVLEVVKKLRQAGKSLIILSNSSKRKENSVRMLQKLGFDPNDFDKIITSGEVAFQMMSTKTDKSLWPPLQSAARNVFVFGSGDEDKEYCEESGWSLSSVEESTILLARGTFTIEGADICVSKLEDEELFDNTMISLLKKAAKLNIPMLVSNPDKVRPDKGRPPMPGKIGDDYEAVLASSEAKSLVKRIGKPFQDVYSIALEGVTDKSRVCMVGDALETDITGGGSNGIDSIWVLEDGIHEPDLDRSAPIVDGATAILDSYNQKKGTYSNDALSPTILMSHFKW